MNPREFLDFLLVHSARELVQGYLFTGVPYVFRDVPQAYDFLKNHLSTDLEVSQEAILVVGSARTGFSLDPYNFPRRFGSNSDIDVIIIDEQLFDGIWKSLLKWHYPKKTDTLGHSEFQWIRKRKDDIFWGWLCPDKFSYDGFRLPPELHPTREIAEKWFRTFRSFAQHLRYPDLARRQIRGRLYRTVEHASLYHEDGLMRLSAQSPRGRG